MEIEVITADLLEDALHEWQQGQNAPSSLLQLHLLADKTTMASPAELNIRLYDRLVSYAVENLGRYRQTEGLPHSSEPPSSARVLYATLASDYKVGNTELEAWSTLYHRFLVPFSLSVDELAAAAHVSQRQFRRRLEAGLNRLVDIVRRAEVDAHSRLQGIYLRRHLPPPDYAQLFGNAEILQELIHLLSVAEGPKFVSIEGLGGIGKTALAQATADHLVERGGWADVLWVSARQETLTVQGEVTTLLEDPTRSLDDIITRLTKQLGQEQWIGLSTAEKLKQLKPVFLTVPHLVIIDNLETMADSQALVPALHPLAGATRFLFTSRYTLREYPYVQTLSVPELSLTDSRELVQSELMRRGQKKALPEEILVQLYNTIGGLPLALKLATAQLGRLPLDYVLQGLQQARHQAPEHMYSHIYRRTWQLLDDPARELLLSMLLISSDGENIDWLRLISALPETTFDTALAQLINYSLLQVTGSLADPVYRLHRLTVTFLQTDILLRWNKEAGNP
ncbi:MAG: hypothetical protein JO125_08430 [Chloroflexi bacterium]|nr:hypothetical protein [Ktedonobacteraceae bacterium]MBV9019204.1 hypothetical protein [Ktedonobacteraceae bacterium]MBV9707417.1 hypothetical protein [Chloroflexota bacterium]